MKAYLITNLVIYAMIVFYALACPASWATLLYLGMFVWTIVNLAKH